MMEDRIQRRLVADIATYVILTGLVAVFLGPFFWLLTTSLKTDGAMFQMPPQWIPNPLTLAHYVKAFTEFPALRYMINTLIIVICSTFGTLLSCSMAAYAFSRLRWPDRKLIFGLLLATMMIPGQVTMIPVYILFSNLQWIDTFLPLIVPAFFANAFFVFLLRQFFMTIPEELLEAARLDGAGEWRVFWQIVLPLSKPALLTVMIFTVLRSWNDFMGPLIYLVSEDKRTLALGLAHLRVVLRQGFEDDLALRARQLEDLPGELQNRGFVRVADVHW